MPQMNKGGKFIFGMSLLRENGTLCLPTQAIREYQITREGKVYLFTGSKETGGFCVTRQELLLPSRLGHILEELPQLLHYASQPGDFLRYKGRWYGWTEITEDGRIAFSETTMDFLNLRPGMELLSIRSSDIAFTMGAKGPLLERAARYDAAVRAEGRAETDGIPRF